MNFRNSLGAGALVLAMSAGASIGSVQAADIGIGQQASQCFVLYKMAATAPANASHKGDIAKLGALMSRTMDDNKVTQKQFDAWTGQFLGRIGAKDKPNTAVLAKERDACNAFAKQRYQHYAAPAGKK